MKRVYWLIWLLVIAACALQVSRTRIVTDITSFLPGAADADQRLMAQELRNGLSTRIMLVALRLPDGAASAPQTGSPTASPSDAQTEALGNASRALRERLATLDTVAWVSNGDLAAHEAERDRLFQARYLLGPANPQKDGALRFSVDELRSAFARLERELSSARGGLIKSIAAADPTLDALNLIQNASAQMAPLARDGVWLGADGRSAILLLEAAARGYEVDALRRTIEQVRGAAQQTLADWPAALPAPTIEFAGSGYFIVKSQETIGKDGERLSLLATVLVGCLLLWSLRSPRLLGLALIPVASGALTGFAAVGLVNGSIHGITLAFGVTLIGEAVDYAIYTFVQREDDGGHAPGFWRKLALAMLTSLIGFAAMFFSGFQGLQQLGLFSIVGLITAAACARWLLPPLLPALRPPTLLPPVASTTHTPPLDAQAASTAGGYRGVRWAQFGWLPGLSAKLTRLRWPLLAVCALLLALLVQQRGTLWLDSLDALSASSPVDTARDARYRQDIGVPDLRTMVVVRGASLDQALQRAEQTTRLLDTLIADGRLRSYDSPSALLPSAELQRRRQAALPDADTLRAHVQQALEGGNLRAGAFEPFIAAVDEARKRAPLGRADYERTIIGRWLDAQIVTNEDGVSVLMLLHGAAGSQTIRAALAGSGIPGAALLDLKGDVEALVAGFRQQAMRAALLGAVGIVLVLALQLRSLRAVASMLASMTCTVILTAWIVLRLEGSLTVFNLVALLLVVGVSSNYTLFFSTLSPLPQQRQRASVSVLLAAASTFIAFAMLSFSTAQVLAMIGSTVSIGAAVGLIASMVFAPRPRPDGPAT